MCERLEDDQGSRFHAVCPEQDLDVTVEILDRPPPEEASALALGLYRRSRLAHPHVVPFRESGTLADGRPFLVTGPAASQTLDVLLQREQMLRIDRAFSIVEQVAAGLAAAHRAGVTHGDLRPVHVQIVPQPKGALLARLDGFRLYATEEAHTASADQYALGALMRRLFGDRCASDPLGAVADRCLEARPEARFEHLDDVVVALARIRRCRFRDLPAPEPLPDEIESGWGSLDDAPVGERALPRALWLGLALFAGVWATLAAASWSLLG